MKKSVKPMRCLSISLITYFGHSREAWLSYRLYRSPELKDQYLLSYVGALERQQQLLATFFRSGSRSPEIRTAIKVRFPKTNFKTRFTGRILKGDFSSPEIYEHVEGLERKKQAISEGG